jgi:tetratricopeptide (TPR) repeat protein
MRRSITRGVGLLAALIALGPFAGCRHLGRRSADEPEARSTAWRREKQLVSPRQAADVQFALGRSLELQGDAEKATLAYKETVRRDPSRGDAYLRLAILSDRQAKFQDSAAFYDKALAARPGDPDVFCDKGYSLYLQNKLPEAEVALRQAIKLNPELSRAHNNLGMVLAQRGRSEAALAEFRHAGGSTAAARQNLAFALALDGRWAESSGQYNLALAADPKLEAASAGLRQVGRIAANTKLAEAAKTDTAVARTAATSDTTAKETKPAPPPSGRRPRRRSLFGSDVKAEARP